MTPKKTELECLAIETQTVINDLDKMGVPASQRSKIEHTYNRILRFSQIQEEAAIAQAQQIDFLVEKMSEMQVEINKRNQETTNTQREMELLSLLNEARSFFNNIKYQHTMGADGKNVSQWIQKITAVTTEKSNVIKGNFKRVA